MDLEERWDEIASQFVPDYELVFAETTNEIYPLFGEAGGDELNDPQEVFDWIVAPIKNDEELWARELDSINEHNVVTPYAINLIEERADAVLPF